MSEWKPIATAPKDGTFLCNDSSYSGEKICIAMFHGGDIINTDYFGDVIHPTHWHPLPKLPENKN